MGVVNLDLKRIRQLLKRAEQDTRLLDGRDFDPAPWDEAYALLDEIRRLRGRN